MTQPTLADVEIPMSHHDEVYGDERPTRAVAPVTAERPQQQPRVTVERQAPAAPIEPAIMQMSGDCGPLFAALAAAQMKFKSIERTLTAKIASARANYTYAYAPLDEVLQAIRPALAEEGIAIMQFLLTLNGSVVVRTLLGHKTGCYIWNDLRAVSMGNDPQSIGSATMYLRRYGLMAITGCAPGYEDDDGAASSPERQVEDAPRPTPRRSEQQAKPPARVEKVEKAAEREAPADGTTTVSKIDTVTERGNGVVVKLANGDVGATSNPELVQTIKVLAAIPNATVSMTTVPPPGDPKRFAPVIKAFGPTRAE